MIATVDAVSVRSIRGVSSLRGKDTYVPSESRDAGFHEIMLGKVRNTFFCDDDIRLKGDDLKREEERSDDGRKVRDEQRGEEEEWE